MRGRRYANRYFVALLLLHFFAQTHAAKLDSIETDDMRLVYFETTQSYLAPHVARCFENSMRFQRSLFGFEPWEPVTVLLTDFSDQGNAGATPMPRNYLSVQIAPISFAYETYPANERMNTLMNHELVHIVGTDQYAHSDGTFRRMFLGKVKTTSDHPETILYNYLTTPRVAAPRWYHEGAAVFFETWMAGGIGRAQGSFDEMVFRSMVRDQSHFYDALGLVSEGTKIDFQVEVNSYLYGTRFISYLAYEYSPEDVVRWFSRTKGSKKYYASQFKNVFGLKLERAWRDWIEWEQGFQQANLDKIREYPTTPHEDLTHQALGSVSRAHYDPETGKVYAAFNYPGVVAHVGAISVEDGSLEKILDVKQPSIYTVTSLTYDPFDKIIYYTTDNSRFRDLRALDPQKRKGRIVKKDLRVGDLAFDRSDRSIWGIRHLNGIVTLVRIPHPYEDWKQIHSWPYGEVVYDIDVSPDGKLLSASIGEIDGRHALHVMRVEDLLAGVIDPVAKVDFGTTIPSNFVFSPDGRYLYGSSYYTGVSNIFRYELETEALELVTNVETGMFRPVPLDDGSVIVFRFTGKGLLPARIEPVPLEDANAITFLGRQIVEKHPVVTEWIAGSPGSVELDPLVTRDGAYKSFKRIGVESLYPIVEGYKDFPAYGLSLNLSDPIGLNSFRFDGSYTPNSGLEENERVHLDFRYERHNWKARYTLNNADFYDLFGPTKVSRKGSSLGFSHKKYLIFDTPRTMEFSVQATAFADLDTLPAYQNIPTTADKLFVASAHLDYSNRRASLGAVDHEKGHRWNVVLAESFIPDRAQDPTGDPAASAGESFPSLYGDFDIGFALPLKHSSIWLRSSAGASAGDFDDPFANFYFGGFGNNWVDHGSVKRYREFYSFPGIELNSALGRNFVKTMLEWNLPPLRFRRVGTPSFYLTYARFSLFTTGLYTNLDGEDIDDVADPLDPMVALQEKVANVGGQVDFRLTVLARLDLTLSLGYSMAQRECVRVFPGSACDTDSRIGETVTENEFMASLKILR